MALLPLTDAATLAADRTYIARVKVAIARQAITVIGEPTATPNNENRLKLARAVLREPDFNTTRIAGAIASQVQDTNVPVTDAFLATAIANSWNALTAVVL